MNLENKVAIITGSTRGIGNSIARLFLENNAKVVICGSSEENAIKAVKNNKTALNNNEITRLNNPIIFRPEQLEAIKKTISRFKVSNKVLWNAKMRFGKTLTALQVAKEMNFKKTIIITHRPVVSEGWYEDFYKIKLCFACAFRSRKGKQRTKLFLK